VVPLLGPVEENAEAPASQPVRRGEANATLALTVLSYFPDGLTWGEWKDASEKAGLTQSQFRKARDKLTDEGRVWQHGEIYFVVEARIEVPMAA
jgi:hypothetical protein